MTATWNFVLHVLNTMPAWLASILVGWAISVGLTQTVKFALPVSLAVDLRNALARCLAFLSAAVPAGAYYATQPEPNPGPALLIMLAAGLWSPFAFAILQAVLRRYWPWLADALSADKRGVVAAKLRGEP